jgi:hypothetical protein
MWWFPVGNPMVVGLPALTLFVAFAPSALSISTFASGVIQTSAR